MQVSKEEVLKIASLARLKLTDDEVLKFSKDLSDILSYAKILDEVNTDGIEPSIQVNKSVNVNREDNVVVFDLSEELLNKSPHEIVDNMLAVKNVF